MFLVFEIRAVMKTLMREGEERQRQTDRDREKTNAASRVQYGGEEFSSKSLPKSLVLGSTEQFMEYAEDGTLIKG